MKKQPTMGQVLEAVNNFRSELLGKFGTLQGEFGILRGEFGIFRKTQQEIIEVMQQTSSETDARLDRLERDVSGIKGDISNLKNTVATLPTKAYLDDKFADERVWAGGLIRGTNEKVHALSDALVGEGSLSSSAASQITSARPFPRTGT